MKNIQIILLLAVTALFTNCDTNDDRFYNSVFVDIPYLVSIEPHSENYSVGENLYINANFSNIQTENGKMLDLFKTTGAAEFTFSYVIEKLNPGGDWQVVAVNDSQLDIVNGLATNGAYVFAICKLDNADNYYKYRVGFPLLSSGNYRLSFGYNSSSVNSVELRSQSPAKRLIMNINSLVTNLNPSGFYNFSVN